MSDNLFDNFLKEKLENHVSPVPADMWQRIQAKKEAERRGGFWWKNKGGIGLGIIGLAIITTFAIVQPFRTETTLKNSNDQSAIAVDAQDNKHDNYPQKNRTTGAAANAPNDMAAASKNENRDVKGERERPTIPSTQHAARNVLPGDHLIKQNNKTENLLTSSSQPTNRFTHKAYPGNSLQYKSGIAKGNLPQTNTADINSGQDFAASNDFNYAKLNVLESLAIHNAKTSKVFSNKSLENLKGIRLTDCPSAFGKPKSTWYVEGFVSPDYSIKTTRNSTVGEEYIRRKDSTESYNGAFTAGIRVSKTMGEHLLVKSGLQFSQINEKFSYRAENERRLTTVVTIRTIIRGPGDTLTVRDTSIVEQIGYRVKTTFNRYRSFDIPVILGYEWGNDEWRGSVNAGVIFNIRSWQQGDMLDTSYHPVSFDKTSSPVFKHNIGLGVYAGVSLIKPIANSLDIFAEPYLRYNISSMTNSSSPFNQKFNIIGINFGVRYKIAGNRQQ